MRQFFPKPYDYFGENVKLESDASNYVTKVYLKGLTEIYKFNPTVKSDLTGLRVQLHKFDKDELKTAPPDLNKLSNGVGNDVVKKSVLGKLVKKVNSYLSGINTNLSKIKYY